MKKFFFILILIAGAGLYYLFLHQMKQEELPPRTAQVESGDIEIKVIATGVVQPQNRLEIKPPIAGRMEEVLVVEGQAVEKGAILAWMSSIDRAALIDAARAQGPGELARWEQLYKAIPVVAPLSGTIIARRVEPGQTVAAQEAVLVMADTLIVKAQVDETDIGDIRLEQSAVVMLDAFSSHALKSKVTHIAYEAETINNVTIYQVDVSPEEVPPFMRSGMTADVTFLVASRNNVLRLPVEALEQEGTDYFVYRQRTQNAGNSATPQEQERVNVTVGISDGRFIEVRDGLQLGDILLVPTLDISASSRSTGTNPFFPQGRPRQTQTR